MPRSQPSHTDGGVNSRHKRRRQPTSCLPCRQRKLRCDRALPACNSCLRRGEVVACSYQSRKPGTQSPWTLSHASSKDVQHRIERLEQLVLSAMPSILDRVAPNVRNAPSTGAHQALEAILEELGHLRRGEPAGGSAPHISSISRQPGPGHRNTRLEASAHHNAEKPFHMGETHWVTLLNQIAEVQGYLKTQQEQYEEQKQKVATFMQRSPDYLGPTLLFGAAATVTSRAEIFAHLPSRYVCDLIVGRFFDKQKPILCTLMGPASIRFDMVLTKVDILHPPSFYKAYFEHWKDPSQTPIEWIALLFAIMRVTLHYWSQDEDEPIELQGKCHDMAASFRTQVAHCLASVDCTKAEEHIIEALVFHLYSEYASFQDANPSVWVLLGTIIRLAMRLGYHQVPQNLPHLSPFQIEMRRRVWSFIKQADILFSFQVGMPMMIEDAESSSNLPRNIYDDDQFHPECSQLPPARPDTEPTPVSILILKTRMCAGFARVLRERNRTDPSPYDQILALDREIREMYDRAPDYYKIHNITQQETYEAPSLLVHRFIMASLHQKSLCVLHSRYLEAARHDKRYLYSRRTCLESALTLLQYQAIRQGHSFQGGHARPLARHQTSISSHDYLLAATIICSELVLGGRYAGAKRLQDSEPSQEKLRQALESAAAIWSEMREESAEAYKASDVLNMLLKRLRARDSLHEDLGSRRSVDSAPSTSLSMSTHAVGPAQEPEEPSTDLERLGLSNSQIEQPMPGASILGDGLCSSSVVDDWDPAMIQGCFTGEGQLSQVDDNQTNFESLPRLLDLSNPVSTLWSLNSERNWTSF